MKLRIVPFLLPFFSFLLLFSACQQEKRPVIMGRELGDGIFALIKTNRGDILCRLDYQKAPLTVANFVGLSEGSLPNSVREKGESYYDGMTWHRVAPNFVIQGGDPNTLPFGNSQMIGRGGPGYQFRNEVSSELGHGVAGTLAMANSGPNTNGSQFYITLQATPQLDGGYNVFGYVSRGMGIVSSIQKGDTIRHVDIIRVGKEAKNFDAVETFDSMK